MFLFILQGDEPPFDETILFYFIGLIVVAFFFNKLKSNFSKKILWIIGSIVLVIGIFLSIFMIPSDSVLFGVVVIFFGTTIIPFKDIYEKIKSKTKKQNTNASKEDKDDSDYNYTQSRSEELISKGQKLKGIQKYEKAIDAFVKALSVNPNAAESWFELGQINLIRNRIPEAITCYQRAIDIKPGYTEAIEKCKEVELEFKESESKHE